MSKPARCELHQASWRSGLLLGCFLAGFGLLSCLERRREDGTASKEARCTQCHGDPNRAGDFVQRSAPPFDLRRASSPDSPGVGAHSIHLLGSATHAAIACNECHVVPKATEDVGHADSARPAELSFGPLSRTSGRNPAYDPVARTCADTWCHGQADAVWSAPRDSALACGSCHALPPPAPHPQSERCVACHADVVDEAMSIIAPALHVDGKVQFASDDCSSCHGSPKDSAPPRDVRGQTEISARGVGAHQAHLSAEGAARALACEECHRVPQQVQEPTHADGLPAEVMLSGVAVSHGAAARWDARELRCVESWCHGPSDPTSRPSPLWNEPVSLDCGGCHGVPPAEPHPQASQCGFCHASTIGPDHRTIQDRERHVDGHVDVQVPENCTGCHGSETPAPPLDLTGSDDPTAAGVGAHTIHLSGTSSASPIPCSTCHEVPERVMSPGHLDGGSAEVVFSGLARAFGADPRYENGRCQNTACHGAVFPHGHASGGTQTAPSWTRVGQGEAACGTCHALPPPRPHPYREQVPNCSMCHENMAPDNMSFVRPDLHIDGVVTFTLP